MTVGRPVIEVMDNDMAVILRQKTEIERLRSSQQRDILLYRLCTMSPFVRSASPALHHCLQIRKRLSTDGEGESG